MQPQAQYFCGTDLIFERNFARSFKIHARSKVGNMSSAMYKIVVSELWLLIISWWFHCLNEDHGCNSRLHRSWCSERGHDKGRKGTTHGKSRDVVTSLEARVSRLESNLGTLGERVDDLDSLCDSLETEDAEIHSGIKDALGGLEADLRCEIESLHSKIVKVRDLFQRELSNVLLRVDEMSGDLTLCE
ncbi:hypothetical protein PanWU01x14_272270 [Parasponia andersonii]|uniref:Uncharacterized protein n=1 Tax=Parasponia andersonii TaxID=3476 RepID=A0A2P5B4H5_PARAD|nr:hypothetical protein PanWU01x14_272270 [Parasponia andersonii]